MLAQYGYQFVEDRASADVWFLNSHREESLRTAITIR